MKIVKFGSVGVVNTLFSYLVFWALIHIGVHYLAAASCSFVAGVVVSYLMNARYTFARQVNSPAFVKFLAVMLASLALSLYLLYLFKQLVGIHVLIAQLLVVLLRFPVVYLLIRRIVFN